VSAGRAFLYALLLAVALAFSLGTRASVGSAGEMASVQSHSGGGLAGVAAWLREAGAELRVLEGPLADVPPSTATVVLAAPTAARITRNEVEVLERFVVGGGTLVYLRPETGQAELDGWLQIESAEELDGAPLLADPGGATAQVSPARGLMEGLSAFRVGTRRGITSSDPHFLAVASVGRVPALLWRPEGRGEVFVAAGADLAENRRLELGDNRVFWARLAARGPLAFDEFHHVPPAAPPLPVGPWAFALQAVLCAVLWAWTRGTHLGPPRTPVVSTHRSALEYADSFGRLLRRSRVETALVADQEQRLRRMLQERMGIPLQAPPAEVTQRLRRQRGELALTWEAWWEERSRVAGRISPAAWWRLSRLGAALEGQLRSGG
jgi:hypothetical protein